MKRRFQRWALTTTIATYALIMVGGMVRAADAGLGCPDWPQCFGRYYPPITKAQVPDHIDADKFDFQLAWIEYTNRLLGVLIGLLILGTLYHAIKSHRHTPRVLYPTLAAFVLVVFEGWLGALLVETELSPWVITAHLVAALIIVSLLLYATVSVFFPDPIPREELSPNHRILARLTLITVVLMLVQMGLGAGLRGELEIVEKDMPTLARGDWIHEVGWIDPVHRSFSWLILLGVAGINYYAQRRLNKNNRWLQRAAYAAGALVAIQVVAGIGLAYSALPPALQVIHLISGSLLIGALMMIYLLTNRVPTPTDTALQADQHQSLLSQQQPV